MKTLWHTACFCLFLLVSFSTCVACRDARLGRIAGRMLGEQIMLPQDLLLLNADGVADSTWLHVEGKVKLVIHFPEEYCTGCRLSANNLLDSLLFLLPSDRFAPMVILGSTEKAAIANAEATIASKEPHYPIYIDTNKQFLKMNPLIPQDEPILQSFLLTQDNRILLVGDPSFDYNIMALYRQVMSDM